MATVWVYGTSGGTAWNDGVTNRGSAAKLKGGGSGTLVFETPGVNAWWVSAVHNTGRADNYIAITHAKARGQYTIKIRGQAGIFGRDDGSPDWELYNNPINRSWRYIQMRLEKSDQEMMWMDRVGMEFEDRTGMEWEDR